MFHTPILFLIFNRPDKTQLVFDEIKKQKPVCLFVHADGPRPNFPDDITKCRESKRIIEEQVDWPCELKTLYRTENLGCGKGPASAISWFFENVDEGIIIEDDCVPHNDFFGYCSELLQKYRTDERIMVIGATTYRDDYPCEHSYTFTAYATMAAWATWKRAWKGYDYMLSFINREELEEKLRKSLYSRFEISRWMKLYDWMIQDGFKDYWDWQMQFLMFYKNGIAIRPQKNMIRNSGIGVDATHTIDPSSEMFMSNRPVYGCLPLNHPPEVKLSRRLDSKQFQLMFKATPLQQARKFLTKSVNRFNNFRKQIRMI